MYRIWWKCANSEELMQWFARRGISQCSFADQLRMSSDGTWTEVYCRTWKAGKATTHLVTTIKVDIIQATSTMQAKWTTRVQDGSLRLGPITFPPRTHTFSNGKCSNEQSESEWKLNQSMNDGNSTRSLIGLHCSPITDTIRSLDHGSSNKEETHEGKREWKAVYVSQIWKNEKRWD